MMKQINIFEAEKLLTKYEYEYKYDQCDRLRKSEIHFFALLGTNFQDKVYDFYFNNLLNKTRNIN